MHGSSDVLVARLAPWRAGMHANRSAGGGNAAAAQSPRSSLAGHNSGRKKFGVITLAVSVTASSRAACGRFLTRSR